MTAIKPRTARVVIYQGDDLARLGEHDDAVTKAEAAVKRAEKDQTPRLLHQGDPVADANRALDDAKAERDAFAAEAEARGVAVVMHARPRKAWRKLMDEHPPRDREKHPEDYPIGPCNIETLPDVLLPESICRDPHCPTCSDEGQRSTIEGDLTEFLESLSDYDYYDRLFLQAFALNRGSAMADPTQRLASGTSQTSDATSS